MVAIKGKTGVGKNPAKGRGKGYTNNPAGKPKGTKNKVSTTVKARIIKFVEDDFDNYIEKLKGLEDKERVKGTTELIKLIVPRPLNEDEAELNRGYSEMIKRLFGTEKG
jgi:hypothetical protein